MKKYFTLTDFLITAVIGVICMAGIFWGLKDAGKKDNTIVIEVDGKVFASYKMDALKTTAKAININTKYGKNTLEIDNGGAKMLYSDCPQQIDVLHGKITKPGEVIVCAPHRLVVYIEGEKMADAVSR